MEFRKQIFKKKRIEEEKRDEKISSKFAHEIELVEECEEDKRFAHLLKFQSTKCEF